MANKLYEESSVRAIASALRLKHDGIKDTYCISDMEDGVLRLPMGSVPSYHYAEAGRVVKRLLELKEAHPNSIVFGTISDNHVDLTTESTMTSARHAAYALESVGSLACDFVANLGDDVSGTNIDNSADYANAVYMENASRYAMTNTTAYNLVGNHCKSNDTQKIYDLIGKYNSFDSYGSTRIRGYGYKDYADKKVRVICLNTCDYLNRQGGNGMSYEQKDFLMRALDLSEKSDYSNWTTIILSHIPLDFLGGDYNKGSDLKAILKAYDNGSSVSITVNSSYASAQNETPSNYATYSNGALVYNYSGKNAPRVVNIHGHIHTNAYGKLTFIDDNTELDIVRVSTSNSSFNGNASTDRYTAYGNYSITSEEASKILKVANTKADTSATFYFFDLDEQIIYSIGYGADIDRTIPYKEVAVYSITYNLTDVTSQNTTTSVIEGFSYLTVLTVDTDYALNSVSVTMGGVDISSSAVQAGGVISISSVTGDIVITATAIDTYVPVWDIANRTAVADMYKGANDKKTLSRKHYYIGACSTGLVDYRKVSGVSVNQSTVTFTSDTKACGIALPYHLESGASYTFSCTSTANARLRKYVYNADGTFVSGSETYSSSGTNLSLTFTAPTDTSQWTMLLLDTNTVNTSITYANIVLKKN